MSKVSTAVLFVFAIVTTQSSAFAEDSNPTIRVFCGYIENDREVIGFAKNDTNAAIENACKEAREKAYKPIKLLDGTGSSGMTVQNPDGSQFQTGQ